MLAYTDKKLEKWQINMSEERVMKYPKDYYASERDVANYRWRRFRPWPCKEINGYKLKAKILATHNY